MPPTSIVRYYTYFCTVYNHSITYILVRSWHCPFSGQAFSSINTCDIINNIIKWWEQILHALKVDVIIFHWNVNMYSWVSVKSFNVGLGKIPQFPVNKQMIWMAFVYVIYELKARIAEWNIHSLGFPELKFGALSAFCLSSRIATSDVVGWWPLSSTFHPAWINNSTLYTFPFVMMHCANSSWPVLLDPVPLKNSTFSRKRPKKEACCARWSNSSGWS